MTARFIQRSFPDANSVWLDGPCPVLVDAGAPGNEAALMMRLEGRIPHLLVNTHWHSDHTGGNHAFAAMGIEIAASAVEAGRINAGDSDACRSRWLRQPVRRYRVSRSLRPGDGIRTGAADWEVVALPGHTTGQIGLFEHGSRVLVAGDSVHAADIGWLDLDADAAALDQAEATVEAIAALQPARMLSGHGPAVTDVAAALSGARRRLRSWRTDPERIAWHACKRIFGHCLISEGGLREDRLAPVLLDSPWFRDHARRAFGLTPEDFMPLLLQEMVRSGAASWKGDRLVSAG